MKVEEIKGGALAEICTHMKYIPIKVAKAKGEKHFSGEQIAPPSTPLKTLHNPVLYINIQN